MKRIAILSVFLGALFAIHNIALASWPSDPKINVPIVVSQLEQSHPSICADGKGGTIIVWEDARNGGSKDIYAQRVSASGQMKWGTNGIVVCNAPDYQTNPVAIADTSGGAYFIWLDARKTQGGNDTDIYAQHVDSSGKPVAGWTVATGTGLALGNPVCADSSMQHNFNAISDGKGGVYVVWEDSRICFKWDTTIKAKPWPKHGFDTTYKCNVNAQASANSTPRAFMQHILYDGIAWTLDGIGTCDSTHKYSQNGPTISLDLNNGVYVVWAEHPSGGTAVYAQNISWNASLKFVNTGKTICTFPSVKNNVVSTADNLGGIYIAWEDGRTSANTGWDIYGQHLDANGNLSWTTDADTLCKFVQDQQVAQILADTVGNLFVVWQDHRNLPTNQWGADLYGQLIRMSDGKPLWTAGGVPLVKQTSDQVGQMLLADGSNGFYLSWVDWRNGATNSDIYSLRIKNDGTGLWTASAAGLPVCTAANSQDQQTMCLSGGALMMAWHDARSATDVGDVYAQIVYSNGTLPVEISSFTAAPLPTPGTVRVAWNTAAEINALGFEVWRQRDAGAFTQIAGYNDHASLIARGTSGSGASYDFVDDRASGTTCSYKLVVVDNDGSRREFGPVAVHLTAPTAMSLETNYPNPFAGSSTVGYSIPSSADVTMRLTDMLGREISRVLYPAQEAGWHSHAIDGSALAPGTYVLVVESAGITLRERVTVTR